MDIRAACAKVEATACRTSLAVLSEELFVVQLAKVGTAVLGGCLFVRIGTKAHDAQQLFG